MILTAFKLLVTGVSVYWLLKLTDLRIAWQSINAVPVLIIFLAVCIMLAGFVVGSFRWWLLLRHTTSTIRYRKILPSSYLGIFFNNILPTTMGGDVIRTLHLSLRGISPKALIGSAIIDRAIGLFTVLALGFVCIGMSSEIIVRKKDRKFNRTIQTKLPLRAPVNPIFIVKTMTDTTPRHASSHDKNWPRQRQKPAHAKPGAQAYPGRGKNLRHQAMR